MGILGRPQGMFDLHDSDCCVGSMLSKDDITEILGVCEEDLQAVQFKNWNGIAAVDERELQKLWYSGAIQNAPPSRVGNARISLDELILKKLTEIAYPDCTIETQVPWGRRRIDLRVTVDGVSKLIEFHGPSHFAPSGYNANPEHPSIRKEQAENHFGTECVIWPYWIQRCTANVKAVFDDSINGLGALWSTNIHFGTFAFPDSAEIIETLNQRFRATRDGGVGYFYGPETERRNNPAHPIIEQIRRGYRTIEILLPRGHTDATYWIPTQLQT